MTAEATLRQDGADLLPEVRCGKQAERQREAGQEDENESGFNARDPATALSSGLAGRPHPPTSGLKADGCKLTHRKRLLNLMIFEAYSIQI